MADTNLVAGTGQAPPAHEAEASALGFTPPMWIALAMLAVFALMIWQKVPRAIGKALDKKIDSIREQLAEAEALREEAEQLKTEYSAKAEAAQSDADAMVERARQEAAGLIEKARQDADSMVERRTRMAEEKIASEQRSAVQQLRAAAADAATRAAARLIAERNDAESDSALIDASIKELGGR